MTLAFKHTSYGGLSVLGWIVTFMCIALVVSIVMCLAVFVELTKNVEHFLRKHPDGDYLNCGVSVQTLNLD